MDVTKSNFPSVLRNLEGLLKRSAFVALDAEMTGITDSEHPERFFDPPEKSFHTKLQVSKKYGLIQIGLCLFEKDSTSGTAPNSSGLDLGENCNSRYIIRPFNFFVFPSSESALSKYSKTFALEPDAIAFNRRHNMDFQRWVYEGVGYCNAEHESAYRTFLEQKHAPLARIDLQRDEDAVLAQRIIEQIEEWKNAPLGATDLVLPNVDSRVIRGHIEGKFQQDNAKLRFWWRSGSWMVSKGCDKVTDLDLREKLVSYIGLREVFKMLRDAKKPLIGHNVLMDVLFLIEAMDYPIPRDTQAFRSYMANTFPTIWDTKILAVSSPEIEARFERLSLQKLFEDYALNPRYTPQHPESEAEYKGETVRELPGFIFPLGFERYSNVFQNRKRRHMKSLTLAHEAAYDALCTGYVFLNLCKELSKTTVHDKCNTVALYKNFHALNVSLHGDSFQWLPRGAVLKLVYRTMTELDVVASLAPLKGQVQWIEDGAAAIVLHEKHSIEEAQRHYAKYGSKVTLEVVSPDQKGDASETRSQTQGGHSSTGAGCNAALERPPSSTKSVGQGKIQRMSTNIVQHAVLTGTPNNQNVSQSIGGFLREGVQPSRILLARLLRVLQRAICRV